MDWPTMEAVLEAARQASPQLVDLTGGSPEMNPNFKRFVEALRSAGHVVQVRSNLTILLEPDQEDTAEFYRDHQIGLVGSLPCYLEENVDSQRGEGIYKKIIEAIAMLNRLGYGADDGLTLNLVYNPAGPVLPPEESSLEPDYKKELFERFGIKFSRLLTITNMPIGRFAAELRRKNQDSDYIQLLRESYNPQTLDGLMCRHQVSINWDGTLYDCDFNLALGLPVNHAAPSHIKDFNLSGLAHRRIVTGEHCFGCTAGSGSSCRGAIVG